MWLVPEHFWVFDPTEGLFYLFIYFLYQEDFLALYLPELSKALPLETAPAWQHIT